MARSKAGADTRAHGAEHLRSHKTITRRIRFGGIAVMMTALALSAFPTTAGAQSGRNDIVPGVDTISTDATAADTAAADTTAADTTGVDTTGDTAAAATDKGSATSADTAKTDTAKTDTDTAAETDTADEPDPKNDGYITVVQEDAASQPICLPGPLVLSRSVSSTGEFFRLTVRASAPPCSPIKASAVRYAMPGNGVAWPQRLVEKKDFTISKAGTTTITFTKTCDAMQFDVVTGATPEVIRPEGPWHGPLLFPLDTETALQHWGCVDSSTTTSTETTTPGSSSSSSSTSSTSSTRPDDTVPTEVGGVSETKPPPGAGGAETEVRAKNESRTGNANQGENLAFTGSDSVAVSFAGVCMMLAGIALVLIFRRRAARI